MYTSAQRQYLAFCHRLALNPLPASEDSLILFVTELAQTRAPSTVRSYLAGVRHLHIIHGLANPLANTLRLDLVCKGIQRLKPRCSQPRLPITPLILRQIKHNLQPLSDFDNAMVWAAACLAFFAFLRSGEFCSSALSLTDVAVDSHSNPTALAVSINRSKTDQFGQGIKIYLSKTDSDLCPVSAMVAYLRMRHRPDGPLFLTKEGRPLSRQFFVSRIQSSLVRAGIDPSSYKSHSFRIGAATTAAALGLSDSLIKSLGRWSSEAFQTYLKIPRVQLATITKSLAA